MPFDKGREIEARNDALAAAEAARAAADDARAANSGIVTITKDDLVAGLASAIQTVVAGQHAHADQMVDAIRDNAKETAHALHKAQRPENEMSPMVSVFNPAGDRDHPRPDLKAKVFVGPFPCDRDTLKVEEIEMINRLEQGEYPVTQKDGRVVQTRVVFERDDLGVLRKIFVQPQIHTKAQWSNWPSLVAALRDILKVPAPEVAALQAELAALRAQAATPTPVPAEY